MKATIRPIWATAFALAAFTARALAGNGVPAWERTFLRELPGAGNQSVLSVRELADGTTMTVVQDNAGITALRYDHAGSPQSSSTFYPVYGATRVAIDAFGGVFVASEASAGFGSEVDIWVMKYDGRTGATAWAAAAIYGAANGRNEDVLDLFVDPSGHVVLASADGYGPNVALVEYDGRTGAVRWESVVVDANQIEQVLAAIDALGNVYVFYATGSGVQPLHLAKYAPANGALVWRRDDVGQNAKPFFVGFDVADDVVVAAISSGVEANRYAGASGQKIWGPARYEAPAGQGLSARALAVGADGSLLIYGLASYGGSNSDLLAKLRAADGALDWDKLWSADDSEDIYSAQLSLAGNGDAIVSARFIAGPGVADTKTWRYSGQNGDAVWGPELIVGGTIPISFVGSNGRVFVASSVSNGTDTDVEIFERDGATGAPVWGPAVYAGLGAGYTHLWDLTATPDGNVVVTGTVLGPDGKVAWATLKYDRVTGAVLWGPAYFPTATAGSPPWGVLADAAGDVVVAGYANGGTGVVKYSGATGAQLWSAASVPGLSVIGQILDPSGNAIVTGYSFNGAGYDMATLKVSGSTGAILWGPVVYDSGFGDFPDRIAADPSGNVFVVGHSDSDGYPAFVLKYAGADGSVLWGPVAHSGAASWSAVDDAGDLFVENYTDGIVTMKISGTTGAMLWGPVSVPSSGSGDAVALDSAGDAYVTGSLYSPATGYDFAVMKYRGSDGALLWGPVTYDGGHDDSPYSLVVDGSGNVAVTGGSRSATNEQIAATLSYDGATGALRWGPFTQNIARKTVNGLAAGGNTIYVGATRGDVGYLVTALTESLGISTLPEGLVKADCGHPLDVTFTAENGTAPYAWSVVGGALPSGVSLGPDGHLSGPASEEGVFEFQVRVQDGVMASADRAYALVVGPSEALVPVLTAVGDDCQTTLSVEGSYAQYEWLPGGQGSPSLVVHPTETTTYGVLLDDGSSCPVRGAVTIRPVDPSCLAPGVSSIAPASGPFPGQSVVVIGSKFQPGAALFVGGLPALATVYGGASSLSATTPMLVPGSAYNVVVVNPDQGYGMLLGAFATDFYDIANASPFYSDVMKVLRAGITAGCGAGNYCPSDSITRAQMAVFLLKARHGSFYVPPSCTGVFSDTPCPDAFAVDWIEQLAAEGITGGCGGGNYCPGSMVTRAQMSAFLLKTEHGSSYVPPTCTGVFADVACGSTFADWIEQLFLEGVTAGCGGGNYCPSLANTRAQMAVFLAKTFALP